MLVDRASNVPIQSCFEKKSSEGEVALNVVRSQTERNCFALWQVDPVDQLVCRRFLSYWLHKLRNVYTSTSVQTRQYNL